MRIVMVAILALAFSAITIGARGQTPEPEYTDLVLQIIWQDESGVVVDKRYLRTFIGPDCDAFGESQVIWAYHDKGTMFGRAVCLPSGVPIPPIELGTFLKVLPKTIVDNSESPL